MMLYLSYFVTVLTVIVSILIIYMKWSLNYWKRRNIPYLEGSIPFGNLKNPLVNKKCLNDYFKEFYHELKKMGNRYGGIYFFSTPIFMPIDPEIVKCILIKDFQSFSTRGFYSNEKLQPASVNLFTTEGEAWRNLRAKFTPIFTSAKMKMMFELMLECGKPMEKYVEQQAATRTPIHVKDCVSRLSTDVVGSCAFGIECNSFKDTKFQQLILTVFNNFTSYAKLSFCTAFPDVARFLRIPLFPTKEANTAINIMDNTIKYRKENGVKRNDFMQLVIEMKDNDVITMDNLRAQCLMFLFAAAETSSTTLTFLLFELACHQDVQDRLRREINETLAEYNGEITYEAIMKMKYLEMVICESSRRNPVIPVLNRKCVSDYKLPDSDAVIEKDTYILIPVVGLHYDPEYFPDPGKFDPERFSDENKHKIVPCTYMPFGDGPRFCIGDRFGKQLVKIGIVTLLKKHKFKLNQKVKLPIRLSTRFVPEPVEDILLDVEPVNI